MVLVTPDGRAHGGADAVVRAMATRRAWWLVLWLYFVWPIGPLVRALYRAVARRRARIAIAEGTCDGACALHVPGTSPPSATKRPLTFPVAPASVGLRTQAPRSPSRE
ncbi:MAG: hypothetical protein OHK0013_37490 [Sandaracinaceae bacterium]